MASLAGELTAAAGAAFDAMGLDARFGEVRRSDKPELADFQCNGAMAAAKAAGKNPREIAGEIAAALKSQPLVLSAEVAGPGFINLRVSDAALSARAEAVRVDPMAGAEKAADAQVTVIDFGGANVAKPMHVGHLRSAVIGDTLQRMLRFLGDTVVSDVHLGDWGLQMGHLVTELEDEQPGLIYFDAAFTGPYPSEPPVTIEDLGRLYPQASNKAKADPARNERSQKAVAEMQAGRAGYRALLRHFIDVSVEALKVDYGFLNVSFDLWKGESDVDHLIPGLVERFKAAGLAEQSDGAWIVHVAKESDKKEMPPVMLVNSRGGTGYHTTDLATIQDRMETLTPAPERMLYVVDQRQALHFEQVYRAAGLLGLIEESRLEHIGFGTVNGPDGKPFKTREGGVLRLADLNNMALEEAQKKIEAAGKMPEDMGEDERFAVARQVAVAALRFSDLMNTRLTNYVFDLDRFTSFEGKTGPYLLYAAVRIKSVLRRAAEAGHQPGAVAVHEEAERALVLQLDGFGAALLGAREKRMPHILCEHLYSLAQAFSAFYGALPIASEADAGKRASRLALADAVRHQLETGLDLLGITVPERM
ncbi:MAG: arginine--tRNA ligase [Hyphomonas sp.]|uniref:arginine--tRNA ligase n=1 Tax=Hyphomonas sp. TaxID=87 RepID=UPI001795B6EC|nr:arginine--tRNA ligase [Hyphomonas sp.]MBU3921286.1 arginine--tRNA ligase [Alphaproteobacteria bacterium]MBA3069621.1 arginine--tRNA ligase [Hyphomonas sp.]MBU4063218.1 arginine--tRNA ligase [Alphaproteobacteria bacterium]MBU4164036.1 arginine--tRNA ligase [Alphaproteobacteria bacterium]MBU4568462.1 arginine--tRNA ligase [Alphaproteobacteria bacterium]